MTEIGPIAIFKYMHYKSGTLDACRVSVSPADGTFSVTPKHFLQLHYSWILWRSLCAFSVRSTAK